MAKTAGHQLAAIECAAELFNSLVARASSARWSPRGDHVARKKAAEKKTAIVRRHSSALAKPDVLFASELVRDLSAMIEAAQTQVATVANVALSALHWQLGHHVRTHVLEGRRAEYGGQIVSTASRQLAVRFGRGFNEKSLRHMVQFVSPFPDREIVSTA